MESRWYAFKKGNEEEIVGSFASPQPEQEGRGRVVQLPADDPRVQTFLGPLWARKDFQILVVESLEDLLVAYRMCLMNPKFGFRGQSDYDSPLETRIERNRDKVILREIGLEQFEQQVLTEAKRRAHLYFEQKPDEFDIMGWFALLRHFGVPTRLLDISWSVFIAAYFAVEQQKDRDGCVWAFSQAQLGLKLHETIMKNKQRLFLGNSGGIFVNNYQPPTYDPSRVPPVGSAKPICLEDVMGMGGPNIKLLFELALRGVLNIEALIFVEPHWMSKRMEMQQGAFLVPLRLKKGFESNLKALLSTDEKEVDETRIADIKDNRKAIQTIQSNATVLKMRIKAAAKDEIKAFLGTTNIRRLVLFPDIDGLSGYLSDLIPSGEIFHDDE